MFYDFPLRVKSTVTIVINASCDNIDYDEYVKDLIPNIVSNCPDVHENYFNIFLYDGGKLSVYEVIFTKPNSFDRPFVIKHDEPCDSFQTVITRAMAIDDPYVAPCIERPWVIFIGDLSYPEELYDLLVAYYKDQLHGLYGTRDVSYICSEVISICHPPFYNFNSSSIRVELSDDMALPSNYESWVSRVLNFLETKCKRHGFNIEAFLEFLENNKYSDTSDSILVGWD